MAMLIRYKSHYLAIVVIAAIASIVAIRWLPYSSPASTSHLSIANPICELGAFESGENIKTTVTIRNSGREPLRYRCIPSCSCSSVLPLSGVIDPFSASSLDVAIKSRIDARGVQSAHLAIKALGDVEEEQSVFLRYTVRPRYVITPQAIDFQLMSHINTVDDASTMREVTIATGSGRGNVSQLSATCDHPDITAVLASVSPEVAVFQVKIKGAPRENFNSLIRIKSPLEEVARIPIQCRFVTPLVIQPSYIAYDIEKPSRAVSIKVIWREGAGSVGPITADQGFSISSVKQIRDNQIEASLTLPDRLQIQGEGVRISIRSESQSEVFGTLLVLNATTP